MSSPPVPYTVRVSAVEDATPRIRRFELVSDGAELPPFEAGSHIEIVTGDGVPRSYSIANDPAERDRYVLAVLREPNGRGSAWMHDMVKVGDRLTVSGPRNAFAIDTAALEHILIAGGVGITPIRSMAYHLDAIGARFRIVYCTRSAEETVFRDDLLARHGERLHLHHDGGVRDASYDLALALRERPPGAHVYICGPRGLIDSALMATAHWPNEAVHVEVFASPPSAPLENPVLVVANQPFEVVLVRSKLTLNVPFDKSILDVVLAAGIKAPYVCREGWCGSCASRLLEGRADHHDEVLEDDEKAAQNTIHICISRALPGERLTIDR